MGDSICWAAYEADTQFTIFDLSALKKQCLLSLSRFIRAEKARVTLATIYLYFKTKDELYGTIMVDVYRHFIHLFREAERTAGTTDDCLPALIRSFISYCRKDMV